MSKYVKRCLECRQVRGVSSFRVLRNDGGRSDCCRWCEERAGMLRTMQRSANLTVATLTHQESALQLKLAEVRMALRIKRHEAAAIARERMVG